VVIRSDFFSSDVVCVALMKAIFVVSSERVKHTLATIFLDVREDKAFIACLSFLGEEQRGCLGEHHRQRW
jgi:hypothetical protein